MSEATRQGQVEEIQEFERGPWKVKVGGRIVRFWAKEFQSDEESEALILFRKAIAEGRPATVLGKEEAIPGRTGKSFTAQSVTLGDVMTSHGDSPSHDTKQFVGREPGTADRWTAARWALSAAIDVLGAGKEVAAYTNTADQFLTASLQLVESLAKPAEAQGADSW